MTKKTARRLGVLLGVAGIAGMAGAGALAADITGPSTAQSPYLVGSQPGVVVKSILTVGDSVNDKPDGSAYRMVGIPDGLGAYDNGNGTFTVLMNHELGGTQGIERAHGAKGSFVSKWTIRKGSLKVEKGEDLIQQIALWNAGGYAMPAEGVVLNRLCSADLPERSALYNPVSGKGFDGPLFLSGEETGAEGRAFAHAPDGTSYELPHLGKFSYENLVAMPNTGDKTIVIGLDDSGNGQVYVYVGEKRDTGNPAERAGLVGGDLYGVKVVDLPKEDDLNTITTTTAVELVPFGDVSAWTGAQLETASKAALVTRWQRPEDGAFVPGADGRFVFVTTAAFPNPAAGILGYSRLWDLVFTDATNPAAGATIEMLLDGTEGQRMMDNLTVTDRGQVIIQEDPGNQDHLAKVWRYSLATDSLTEIATHDPARFTPGAPGFITRDEESSGVIPMDHILGEGWLLADVQSHKNLIDEPELVQDGQLLALRIPPGRTR
jgi:hypothetical protein